MAGDKHPNRKLISRVMLFYVHQAWLTTRNRETGCIYAGSHRLRLTATSILNSKLNSITWLSEHLQHQQTQPLPFKHGLLSYLQTSSAKLICAPARHSQIRQSIRLPKHEAIGGMDQSFRSPLLMLLRQCCGQCARTGCPNSNSRELCSQNTGCCTEQLHPKNIIAERQLLEKTSYLMTQCWASRYFC